MRARPADIVTGLRDYGLTVVQYPGWETRGARTSSGALRAFDPIAQLWHHDVFTEAVSDATALRIFFDTGRPDLKPPLCNGWIDSDSRAILGAYGNANHAGWGEADVIERLRRGLPPVGDAREDPDRDSVVGNPYLWGWECRNAGDGVDVWEQLDAMERAGAAMCDVMGWEATRNAGHREFTARKIDPRGFDMRAFRADIARIMIGHDHHPEDLMQLAPLDIATDPPLIAQRWYKRWLNRDAGVDDVQFVEDLLADPAKTYGQALNAWHLTASKDPAYRGR